MICPFMSYRVTIEARECHKKHCAIWDEEHNCCSLKKQNIAVPPFDYTRYIMPTLPNIPYEVTSTPSNPQQPAYITCHSSEARRD